MTLAFLKELGIEEAAAQAVLDRYASVMAEAKASAKEQNDALLAQAKAQQDALCRQISDLSIAVRTQKIDSLLKESGLRSATVRKAARDSMLAFEEEADAQGYLASLRENEPDLFDSGALHPCFAGSLAEESEEALSPPFHYLRQPDDRRGGCA